MDPTTNLSYKQNRLKPLLLLLALAFCAVASLHLVFRWAAAQNPGIESPQLSRQDLDPLAVSLDFTPVATSYLPYISGEASWPAIDITKTARPTSVPEIGGDVTFTFVVANIGAKEVTVTSLIDDRFGSLLAEARRQNGGADIVLAPGKAFTFTIKRRLVSDSLTAHVNRVDVIAVDEDNAAATDYDTATVTFTNVAPAIDVTKTARPTSVPKTGGDVTFTFVIANTGVEEVTVTSLIDNRFGDLLAEAKRQNGGAKIVLAPGKTFTFTIKRRLASDSLTAHVNRIDVIAVDDDSTAATGYDTATVTFTDVEPVIGCNPTGGTGGLAPGRYGTTVAGLNATVVVGQGYDPQVPTYLGFFVHGDNGVWTKYQTPSNPVTRFVDQQSWIFVAPQSPNDGKSWWTNWEGDHNEAFAAVLDEMFARYNVCRNVVFGSSGSGGSEYWTRLFFPEKGGNYPAHTVIGCGGNDGVYTAVNNQIIALGRDPNVVTRSTFEYVYGTEDRLYDTIQRSIAIYTRAGFHVIVDELEGAGHCNQWTSQGLPDLSTQIAAHWEKRAKALQVYRDQ